MKNLFLLVCFVFCVMGSLFSVTNVEILNQDTPSELNNGEYGPLLKVAVTNAQVRCASFSINNTFDFLECIKFEDLQWKEDLTGWESLHKVSSDHEITTPSYMNSWNDEVKVFTLWGKVIVDSIGSQNAIRIGWESADYLWVSGNYEICSAFPQHKVIIIHNQTVDANDNFVNESVSSISLTNYPNPFNPSTTISFDLTEAGSVKLEVFNVRGQKVITLLDGHADTGESFVIWEGRDDDGIAVASGIYFFRLTSSEETVTKKMLLMK